MGPGVQNYNLYITVVHFSVLIRHLWQPKSAVSLGAGVFRRGTFHRRAVSSPSPFRRQVFMSA
jgi:hypothetical protein